VTHVLVILLTQQEVGVKRGVEKRVQAVHLDKVREGVQAVYLHKVEVKGAQEEGVQAVKGKDKVRVKALQLHNVEVKIRQEEGVKAVQLLHKVGVKRAISGCHQDKNIWQVENFCFTNRNAQEQRKTPCRSHWKPCWTT